MKMTVRILKSERVPNAFKLGIVLNDDRFGVLGFTTSEDMFSEPEAQFRAMKIISEFEADHDSIPSAEFIYEDLKKETK